jgi:hypothetical protein
MATYPISDDLAREIIPDTVVPKSQPSNAILFMHSLEKAANELSGSAKKLADEELTFYRAAADIIANDGSSLATDEQKDLQLIKLQYNGLQGVLDLADRLRDIAFKQRATKAMNTVIEQTATAKSAVSKDSIFS